LQNKNQKENKLKKENFTYKVDPNGFTILYGCQPIGSTVVNGKMTSTQVERIKKIANSDIDLIINGKASKYWKNLNRILGVTK